MRTVKEFDDRPWMIVPVRVGSLDYHRSNVALISALAFIVIGVFVMTLTPGFERLAAAATNALRGVQVQNLTPALARELEVPQNEHGVVITSEDPSSAAAAAGLERGDVIEDIDRQPVDNVREYEQVLGETHGQSTGLVIDRNGSTQFIEVQGR